MLEALLVGLVFTGIAAIAGCEREVARLRRQNATLQAVINDLLREAA